MTAERPLVVAAEEPLALDRAVAAIVAGDLVALPTETVYGLACALERHALERLTRAKQRAGERAITLLVDSLAQVEALAQLPAIALRLAERFWPGPLTLVLPLRETADLPDAATGLGLGGVRTAGFRLPDHPVPRTVARALGPLPLTSANRSGEPDALDAGSVVRALGASVAVVIDGGPVSGGVPSTVVRVGSDGTVEVLREGALPTDRILAVSLAPTSP